MNHPERSIIAVVTAVANNSAQKELLLGISECAQALGYDTAVFSNIYNMSQTDENLVCEQRIYDLILSEQVSAVILDAEAFVNKSLIRGIADLLLKKNTPLVLVGEQSPEFSDPRFLCINTSGCADLEVLTDHLIEVHGYTQIDMLTGPEGNSIAQNRLAGYQNALRKHGIVPEENGSYYGDFWMTSGAALAERYISGELSMPQAIVCANDCMAFGLLRTFLHHNIRVPEDVAVVGYEFSERRIFYSPLLTVYRRNRKSLGEKAVLLIHSLLHDTDVPDLTPLPGELICGESCPCHADTDIYHAQLEHAIDMKDYEINTLFSTMEQKMTSCRNLDEFAGIMGEFQWMIRYVQDVFLCLYADWYEQNPASSMMSCRSIIPWLDTTAFEAHEHDFAALLRKEKQPAVYYFTPVFFASRLFGHIVLKYNEPDGYDSAFRSWIKSVSNGLEFLRMKNDIQYLISCQDLSNSRDMLTDMYNKKGMKQIYNTASPDDGRTLYFIMLRVCMNDLSPFITGSEHKVNAVLSAAKAVQEFCDKHDIAGYMGDQTFVCLIQSNADVNLLCDALTAILIRHREYMDAFGMDSFFCTGEACGSSSFDWLYETCAERTRAHQHLMKRKRSVAHYAEMVALRNAIYAAPEQTFEQGLAALYPKNSNSVRMAYKKCFGISFHQDCINARITKAKYYLTTTSLSLIDTAEKCGYLDQKYFQRQFTANVGITAGQYRNLIKL